MVFLLCIFMHNIVHIAGIIEHWQDSTFHEAKKRKKSSEKDWVKK